MKAVSFMLSLTCALAGCSDKESDSNGPLRIVPVVGRNRFIAAENGFPPMILDTATGCVEALSVADGVVTKTQVEYGPQSSDVSCALVDASAVRKVK